MENIGEPQQGVIALTVFPAITNVAKMNLSSLVVFRVGNLTIPIKSWKFLGGELQLFFEYT